MARRSPAAASRFQGLPEFARRVLDVVELIPPGSVMSYGDIAEYLGEGGPRQVAQVMSRYGSEVPWFRVLRADGSCAPEVGLEQLPRLLAEHVPVRPSGRVDMQNARWDGRSSRSGHEPDSDARPRRPHPESAQTAVR